MKNKNPTTKYRDPHHINWLDNSLTDFTSKQQKIRIMSITSQLDK